MMNLSKPKERKMQMKDWRRRFLALVMTLSLLISSCGLTAFAESESDSDGYIYSEPVGVPAPWGSTSPEPEEGETVETPASEGQSEAETGTEEGIESEEPTGGEEPTGTEGEPEESEEPEPVDLTVYEPGTLTAEADGIQVTLDYTAEARVPEGTVLTLARAAGGDLYSAMKSAAKVLRTEINETWQREMGDEAVFYAIALTNPEGNEVHPKAGVTLTCSNLSIPADATGFVTGDQAENIDWDGSLTIDFLPDAIGYAYLKQVQIGNITLVHEGADYTVTATYGPDAGFPASTKLEVREIMPGTAEYALYSGMTEETLGDDWKEITLERYFDITFVHGEEELEPQADVDVQITFHEKLEQNEETDIQAVHIEENEATVIETDTDSTKVAVHDDEAIDTVTFTSDSFSVYGVVQRKKIVTKVLDAQGHTYEIEVTYNEDAEIPEGAQVKVEEIPEGSDLWEAYRIQTAAALNADDVVMPGLYDITIVDAEGNPIEPKAAVNVAIKLLKDENTTEDIQVVHFTEEMPQELVEAVAQPEEQTTEQIETQTEEQPEGQTQPEEPVQTIESETIDATVDGDVVTFETNGFSVYAFVYTVDFEYLDASFEMLGNSEILLSDLLNNLATGADISSVTSVSYTGTAMELTETENHDWLIKLTPKAEEQSVLTVRIGDTVIDIDVAATGKESVELDDGVISAADGVYLPNEATGQITYVEENEEIIALIEQNNTETAEQEDTTEATEEQTETTAQTEETKEPETTEQTETTEEAEATEQTESTEEQTEPPEQTEKTEEPETTEQAATAEETEATEQTAIEEDTSAAEQTAIAEAAETTEQTEAPEQTDEIETPADNKNVKTKTITETRYQVYDISLDNVDEENYESGFQVEMKLNASVQGENVRLWHVHDDQVTEIKEFDLKEDTLSFVTENFSYFVISYTVDFTYIDEEGVEHFWQFPGTGSHLLREVLTELDIDTEDKAITDPTLELIEVVGEMGEKDLYLTQDEETKEWYINSDNAFDEVYELTVTLDHTIFKIEVTDDQSWTLIINLLDYDGNPLSGEKLTELSGNIYGIEADTSWGYKTIGIQINAATVTSPINEWPTSPESFNTIRIYNNNAGFDLNRWKNLDHNEIHNYHIQELEGFEIKTGSINLDSNTKTLSVDFQQAYIKQYNVRFAIQDPGLTITDADKYYVYVDMQLSSWNHVYGYNQIIIEPDQTIVDVPITKWYDNNKNQVSGIKVADDSSIQVTIYTRPLKSDGTKDGYDNFGTLYEGNNRVEIRSGASINRYNVYYAHLTRGVELDTTSHTKNIFDTVTFTTPNGTISKGYIDNLLKDATDFGYYTGEFKGHAADMEATIGAAKLSAKFSIDYGYSSNNLNVNRLKVLKIFTDTNGNPVSNKRIGINLRKDNNIVDSKEKTTGEDGKLEFEFTNLAPGEYNVSEVLYDDNNQPVEIFESGTANVGDVNVNFSETTAHFVNNSNMNYFGTIAYNNDNDLYWALYKGTRVPLVILTDTDDNVDWVQRVASTLTNNVAVDVYKAGTNDYKKYDILSDLARLEALSNELWNATDSSTVKFMNLKASEIRNGFQIEDDGRYIVLNILMNDGDSFCPYITLGTHELEADYGQTGEENSSKILFNLRSADGSKPYGQGASEPPSFNTTKEGAGIILAPCANSHNLGGDFSGTIIAATVNHAISELHSNNPNQMQKLNITIHNILGTPNVGSLMLKKAFVDDSIKDIMTWFTFKVTVSNPSDQSKIQGQSFWASGLESGDTVTFNQSGIAYVKVRPSNSVTIANLPAGATYTVEEINTAETSHYKCVGIVYPEQTQTHEIPAGQTAHVTVNNDVRRTGLTLKKTVDNTDATDATFTFDLYLWNEEVNESNNEVTRTAYTSINNVTVTGTSDTFALVETNSSDAYYPAGVWSGITLTNGQQITINGLPLGLHYAFVERTGLMPVNYGVVTENGTAVGVLIEDGSEAEVINRYYAPIDLGLQKKWKLTTSGEITAPIGTTATFELKRIKTVNGDEPVDDNSFSYTGDPTNVTNNRVTMPVDGQWSYTFTNLPVYEVIGGIVTTYKYYLVEVGCQNSPEGLIIEYLDSEGNPIEGNGTIPTNESGTQTINNKVPPVSIEATKTWKSNSQTINSTIKNAMVIFELQSRTRANSIATWSDWAKVTKNAKDEDISPKNPYTLSVTDANEAAWKVTWNDLLKNDNIEYRVIETYAKVGDEELVATDSDYPIQVVSFVSGKGTVCIENTLPTTQITVKKSWSSSSTWPDEKLTVQMTLKKNGGEAIGLPAYNGVPQTATVSLSSANAETGHTWYFLPKYDKNGDLIIYTVAETGMKYGNQEITNYRMVYTVNGEGEGTSGLVTIDNTPATTSIQVTKIWMQNNVAVTNKQFISYTLYRTDSENPVTVSENQIAVNKGSKEVGKINYVSGDDGGWQTVTISGLQKYNRVITTTDEGTTTLSYNPITYYVVETDATADAGYMLTPTYSANNGEGTTAEEAAVNEGTITIINTETSGVALPSTGGSGTLIYTIAGLAMISLAGVILVSRKRKFNR